MKIFPKTFIYTISILGSVIILAHAIFYFIFPVVYKEQQEKKIKHSADILMESLKGKDVKEVREILDSYSKNVGVTAHIKEDIDGGKFTLTHDLELDINKNNYYLIIEDRQMTTKDGKRITVQVVSGEDIVEDFIRVLIISLPIAAVITLLFSVVFSYFYSKKIVKPLIYIADTTKRMENMDVDARFVVNQRDEIGEVGARINKVYEKLLSVIEDLEKKNDNIKKLQQQKVNFLRSASHELKTPLTSLRIILENMIFNIGKYKNHEEYLKKCVTIIDNLDVLLKEILESSKFQEWTEHKEIQNLNVVLDHILIRYEELRENKNIRVTSVLNANLEVLMSMQALDKVMSNVISNAIKYTPQGGEVSIYNEDNILVIDNTCTPLTGKEMKDLFKISYHTRTIDKKDDGNKTGLGLYIVKNILESYNLSYSFTPYEKGMRLKIALREDIDLRNKS
ncbi:ATP-binding protein [Gemella cuniculi]